MNSPEIPQGGRRQRDERQPAAAEPLVSIITVVRNGVATVEQTILSVLDQSYIPIEYIVIDGASTDGTIDRIRTFDDRLAYWRSEPDAGISDAFNKGIALARGSIIGLLNADDAYEPDAVATAVAVLARDPGAGFVFGHLRLTDRGRSYIAYADSGYARIIARRMPTLNHPTVFMRAAVYAEHGTFRTDLRLAMDYELLLRIHRCGIRGVAVDRVLATMRLGGLSHQQAHRRIREAIAIAREYGLGSLAAAREYGFAIMKLALVSALLAIGAPGAVVAIKGLFHRLR